jgi:hypothetical protein
LRFVAHDSTAARLPAGPATKERAAWVCDFGVGVVVVVFAAAAAATFCPASLKEFGHDRCSARLCSCGRLRSALAVLFFSGTEKQKLFGALAEAKSLAEVGVPLRKETSR